MVAGKSSPAAAVQHSDDIHKMKLELELEQKKMTHIQLKLQGHYSAFRIYVCVWTVLSFCTSR